jgi:hypothetical protein
LDARAQNATKTAMIAKTFVIISPPVPVDAGMMRREP